ncbi:hypothetical protein, partial [Spirulina sp. 06S082]|uniref:hypothetical protein n=1 Tax=Spirulina sp. 06S082 TaxID=3110248 RepID=UPI002B21DA36
MKASKNEFLPEKIPEYLPKEYFSYLEFLWSTNHSNRSGYMSSKSSQKPASDNPNKQPESKSTLDEIRATRLEKVEQLKQEGLNPFAYKW